MVMTASLVQRVEQEQCQKMKENMWMGVQYSIENQSMYVMAVNYC